jgi:hypothetical protein
MGEPLGSVNANAVMLAHRGSHGTLGKWAITGINAS